jgi:hypothetical protein
MVIYSWHILPDPELKKSSETKPVAGFAASSSRIFFPASCLSGRVSDLFISLIQRFH